MERTILHTADNSYTVHVKELDETYHSTNGAYSESMHVFIEAGLKYVTSYITRPLVLEAGYGTGLNAALTLAYAQAHAIEINYHAVEAYPLDKLFIDTLEYGLLLPDDLRSSYQTLKDAEWNKETIVSPCFRILKIHSMLQTFSPAVKFDLIYYDAFSPNKQPELWDKDMLLRTFAWLNKGGVLVTYCAKGDVRRNLEAAGFKVERLQGAAGKREMIRATRGDQ